MLRATYLLTYVQRARYQKMLRPAEMRELRIVALDKDVDPIIKRLDALGNLHVTDITEFLDEWEGLIEPSKAEETALKASELLTRMDNLIASLKPPAAGEESEGAQPVEGRAALAVPESVSLAGIETEFGGLEKTVAATTGEMVKLHEAVAQPRRLLRVLQLLDEVGLDLDFVGEQEFTTVQVGRVPARNQEELRAALDSVVGTNHLFISKPLAEEGEAGGTSFVFTVLAALKRDKAEAERALRMADFEPYQLPLRELPSNVKDAIAAVEATIKRHEAELAEKEQALAEMQRTRLPDLLRMRELVQIEESKAKLKILFGASERVRVIEGWTPKDAVDTIIRGISEEVGGLCVIEVREPKREDVRVPSLLKNHQLVKPFESIIRMYSLPSYRDIDPTLITAIIFPVLFGLMFPDIGHGFLLLILGLLMVLGVKKLKGMKDMGTIISLCGVCSIGGGILFGEFFGFSEYAAHLLHESMHMEVPHLLHTLFIHKPLWFEPIPNVQFMFIVCLFIGALHMGLGICLSITNKLADHDLLGTLIGIAKVWCLFGALYFLLLLFGFHFTELKDANIPVLLRNATGFVVLPLILLILLFIGAEVRHAHGGKGHSHGKLSAVDFFIIAITGVIEAALENFFRFLANSISYGRILALALAHAALIEVFILFTFMSSQANIGLAVVIFIAGTAIVIILEALMSGIHAMRLHYYEWFTKFYEGGGVEFKPFTFQRTYTR